ncbi:MAG: hypothetical protein EOP62_14350 [Sphingomonadales bacterium]|nr:MAG: hypothetical protein EOP62_14350 [Sphingomonadales bacterium]
MPRHDTNIDMKPFGLALKFTSPGKHDGPANAWRVEFDTGIIIHAPDRVFGTMTFQLAEAK